MKRMSFLREADHANKYIICWLAVRGGGEVVVRDRVLEPGLRAVQ